MSVPNSGTPAANEMVPSIGSITQRKPLVPSCAPCSSPSSPSSGKSARIWPRSTDSISRSASVTGDASLFACTASDSDWKYRIATVPARSASVRMSATREASA
jgi:hypothetical protein